MSADATSTLEAVVRPATVTDAEVCGRICYEGFKALNERHGFPPNYPSVEAAIARVQSFLGHPAVFGVVAVGQDGRVLGFNFLSERDPIRAVGPIVVDPVAQGRGVGRQLMAAVLERTADAPGVRLAQEAFNLGSLALYVGLGFEAREPLVALAGRPVHAIPAGWDVRPLRVEDLAASAALYERVHGHSRANELREAMGKGLAWVASRDDRVVTYAAAATAWLANHGVAETEEDMAALLAGAARSVEEPVALLLPIRQAGLFRWCLAAGLRQVKPMVLMSRGEYREPRGAWFPSILY
ncbi:GNAT family N-acetyltransferase [Geminicoccus harenae]|uniref:GNAT family N-acetyltransferase n=1 Tax=Geminicoccus harenae TaxID=2498453 RepID=UPI001C9839F6|nr:GNAT family N-acetyltransferase [Geminicoccus harenae]